MPTLKDLRKLNERGVVSHLLILLLLGLGIAAGVYLTQSGNLKLFSKAGNPPIVFKSTTGEALPTTGANNTPLSSSYSVKIELTSPFGLPVYASPTPSPVSSASCNLGMYIKFQDIISNGPFEKIVSLSFRQPGTTTELWKFENVYANTNTAPLVNTNKDLYRIGISGVTCGTYDVVVNSNGYQEKKFPNILIDENPNNDPETYILYGPLMTNSAPSLNEVGTTKPVMGVNQALSIIPVSGTVSYKIAENPNTLATAVYQPYTKEPTIIDYTFKPNPNQGRFIWVEFLSADGKKERKSAQVIIKPSPALVTTTSAPTCQPRPACLDAEPRCLRNEPIDGWCPTPSPTPTPAKKVFVTSIRYNSYLQGLAGADLKCQSRADAANLGGNWKAWLSDSKTHAATRLSIFTDPQLRNSQIKLVNGDLVANNSTELALENLKKPINITEFGLDRVDAQDYYVWTASFRNGAFNNNFSACEDWYPKTPSIVHAGVGWSKNTTDKAWSDAGSIGCGAFAPLYCFEQ